MVSKPLIRPHFLRGGGMLVDGRLTSQFKKTPSRDLENVDTIVFCLFLYPRTPRKRIT